MTEPNLFEYTEDSIKSLDWREHIRLRPGMYIGKLGDGSSADDGIYVLVKEVLDNCIDEHTMGYGKQVEISIQDKTSLPVNMVILFPRILYNVSANEIYELAFILTFEVSKIPQVILINISTFI